MQSTSPSQELNGIDYVKIVRNIAIYALPLVFAMQAQIMASANENVYIGIAVSALLDMLHRWYKDNTK